MTDTDSEPQSLREYVRETQDFLARHYATVLQRHGHTPTIAMYDVPTTDEYGTMTIGQWGGYLVQIMPMLFNDRLVLTPEKGTWGYDHGWCYPKGGAAFLAAVAWNPETEPEPAGYKKRATAGLRKAGEIAPAEDRQWMGDALSKLFSDHPEERDAAVLDLLAADKQAAN